MLYRVLYDIRYIKIILNIMKMVFEKKFGKSRVRYIVGSLIIISRLDCICKSPIVGYDDADKRFVASATGSSNIAIALKVNDINNLGIRSDELN